MAGPDWGAGHYEFAAEQVQLLPAARAVVETAAIRPGERVLDLGCGTGNATLLAAEHSGQVTGVDPAARLLEVARTRAASENKRVTFLPGEAGSLPVGDASADAIVSVFAVIFAPDPGAAAKEMSRALAASGRIVLSAWIPAGTMFEITSAMSAAVQQATGTPAAPPPFAWHDRDALRSLLAPYGFMVEVSQHQLTFTAPSAQALLAQQTRNHPLAVAALDLLDRLGQADALRTRLQAILEERNEDPDRLLITSSYVIATATRHPA
ncbi:MAG TPA: methyltransferase domain-containing protein [Trebonia sp.]